MKRTLLRIALLVLPLAAYADTVDLGAHGTFSITVPANWKLSSHKEEDSGYALTLSPPASENAKCLVNITFVAEPKAVSKENVDEEVLSVCDQFVDQSVEKKKVLRDLARRGAPTDLLRLHRRLHGRQAPQARRVQGDRRRHRPVDDKVMAAFSVAADDEKGPDFASMLAAVSGACSGPGSDRAPWPAAPNVSESPAPITIGAVLFDGFELLDVFGPLEMFAMLEGRPRLLMIAEKPGRAQQPGSCMPVRGGAWGRHTARRPSRSGGLGTRREMKNEAFLRALARRSGSARIVSSVCTGSLLLARRRSSGRQEGHHEQAGLQDGGLAGPAVTGSPRPAGWRTAGSSHPRGCRRGWTWPSG